jgi:hypothetical protein
MSTTISAPDIGGAIARPDREIGRTGPDDSGDLYAAAIELRLLGTHEAHLVRRLAALDDARELDGQVLVALIGGQAVAALSLRDQRIVANPFVLTSDAVALLRLRAAQLSNGSRRVLRFPRARLMTSDRSAPRRR